ncbi:MAG: 2-amino-4-hydroxy-6-hydroxymethyldihydropteridine diphosphokinase [Candidatus Melainabacteria bacterium RIFCSPLOWO2_02_FULL_35_15]|nr:MAG: 2-amino-4-hydroxy-6-hydroxymethyldihydropteridine diphosphokinase [Candidatus Melainabacteria bacterium RIFCSPLOWO2_12_FULL_35_11]OGI14059.1 MAG: 2-amino-4-hydroxy-6-hydroxymethyldihydropteridine diphosphokinase [Candidatus Melainabacteria bacterium RIFCSPLOWO2_02_FULL_35_15]
MLKNKTNNNLKASNLSSLKTVYLGIGTNKGTRETNISSAINLLSNIKGIKLLKISKMLKNPPQEGIKSGYFLNGAIKLLTSLTPLELLKVCKKIEKKQGRKETRIQRRKISRVIDLDILFYGNEIINTKELTIPHPMIEKRYFVLIPLMEIAKRFVHPLLKKSIKELYIDYCAPTSIKNCASAV